MKDIYSEIDWGSIFFYNPESPSGLSWLVSSGRKRYGDSAGSMAWNDKNQIKPKCWDVRRGNRLYKVHRIIWILQYGQIDNSLVINHKDNNPHNNLIENLELVTQEVNLRRCRVHNTLDVQINNSSGLNGVAVVRKEGGVIAYSATLHDAVSKTRKTITFSIASYGEILAKRLAETARQFLVDDLKNKGVFYGPNVL